MEICLSLDLANELSVDGDGWVLLAPYGRHPHLLGTQLVDRGAATTMQLNFANESRKLTKVATGKPVYCGHPDYGQVATENLSRQMRGLVTALRAADEGLKCRMALLPSGRDDVLSGKKYLSPHWGVVRENVGGPVFIPLVLYSVGLTAAPNIPGPSLANSAQSEGSEEARSWALFAEAMRIQGVLKCTWDTAWHYAQTLKPHLVDR